MTSFRRISEYAFLYELILTAHHILGKQKKFHTLNKQKMFD